MNFQSLTSSVKDYLEFLQSSLSSFKTCVLTAKTFYEYCSVGAYLKFISNCGMMINQIPSTSTTTSTTSTTTPTTTQKTTPLSTVLIPTMPSIKLLMDAIAALQARLNGR